MKSAMLIFGAFCIAYNMAAALHELGHAVAAWISGGLVLSIYLHPFTWNWTLLSPVPNQLLVSWGGVVFGALFTIALSLAAMPFRSPYLAPLYILGGCGLAINGIYLSIAAFGNVGDAGDLMRLGMPRTMLVGIGICLLLTACAWMSWIQPRLGVHSADPFSRRLSVLEFGVCLYLGAMLTYVIIFERDQLPLFLAFMGAGIVALLFMAICGHIWRVTFASLCPVVEPTWAAITTLCCIGVGLVIFELYWFGSKPNFGRMIIE